MGIDHYASDGSAIVGVYFVYDTAGRIVRNRRDGTMTYYEYDANGRLTAERLNADSLYSKETRPISRCSW